MEQQQPLKSAPTMKEGDANSSPEDEIKELKAKISKLSTKMESRIT